MHPTNPPIRQVQAIRVREKRRSRDLPRLRAPISAILLSLLVFLSPDLTLAPLSAGEPQRAGPVPIDQVGVTVRPRRIHFIDSVAPTPVALPDALQSRADDEQFEAAIAAARAAAGAYGITFAAVRDGALLWTGADGRQRDALTSLAADDPLVIGSVTKTFVAATVLQLVEEGRLELDDAVRDHLPGMSSVSAEITIRQLLDHTSGLADVFNDRTRKGLENDPEHAWTTAEVFETLHAPWYGPGQGWAYANTNYFLLGLVVERVTGSSLATELDERFLVPLELDHTRLLTGATDDGGPLAPAWATIFWASGSMTASAADLARWGDALYGGDILSTRSRAAMTALNSNDYGMGLQRLHLPGAEGYGHTGLLNTYTSLLIHLPEHDLTLALLVNRSDVNIGSMLAARPPNGPSLLELVGVEWPPVAP